MYAKKDTRCDQMTVLVTFCALVYQDLEDLDQESLLDKVAMSIHLCVKDQC